MTRLAYFDLANGISGDMALAGLVDAGHKLDVDVEHPIIEVVASLGLDCTVSFVDDERGGLACLRAEVKTDGARHQPKALREAIARSAAPDVPKRRALQALEALVEAEAHVHGTTADDVHLHELASADTAVDLLGAAVGLHALGIGTVAAAAVPVPMGWVTGEHGAIPLPAPVVLELLTGATLKGVDATKELVTPSGAAILVAHQAAFGPLPEMTLEAVGIGAGSRITERPNVCRVLVGEAATNAELETCVLLETNIDDQTPEMVSHALEALLEHGALDCWITPVVMKKGRPAFLLSVLAKPADEERLAELAFRHTTTLGIRRRTIARRILEREHVVVTVRSHQIRVKVGRLRGEVVNVAPEFDDCAAAARALGVPIKDIHAQALSAARPLVSGL
jgi:uncharacterized protein (TIGR00299 family) protein